MVMHLRRPDKSRLEIARIITIACLLTAFIFGAFFWRLGSLTAGLSPSEVNARFSSSSLSQIADNPIYAPHKLLQHTTTKIFGNSNMSLRSTSAFLAIIFLVGFYLLVKSWFGKLIGFFATLFLAATAWFILLARSAGPEILMLAPLLVLLSYYWLVRSKKHSAWIALLASLGLVIYLPGGTFLILVGLALSRRSLSQAIKDLSLYQKLLGVLAVFIILGPLVYACTRHPAALKPLLLIPSDWPSIIEGFKSIAWNILAIFWRTPVHGDFIIGRLPIMNGAQITLALFGGFALFKLARDKLYLLLGIVLFGVVAAAVNRNLVLLTFILPAVTLFIAAGLRYLYMEWRSVFPRNPLPKYLALILITLLTAMHVFYGLRYSLDAWPNTDATRSTYVLK